MRPASSGPPGGGRSGRCRCPLLSPAIAASAAIVFLFTFTSFGVVLILGGPGRATIEVEIHRATTQLLDLPLASTLALLQLAAVLTALAVYGRLTRRVQQQRLVAAERTRRPPRTAGERWFLRANLGVIVLLVLTPLAVLVERSLVTASGYGWDNWQRLLVNEPSSVLAVPAGEAVRNSLAFGVGATLVALVVGGLAATAATVGKGWISGMVDRALMVPLGPLLSPSGSASSSHWTARWICAAHPGSSRSPRR
jgi:thiamine transport system permease protein